MSYLQMLFCDLCVMRMVRLRLKGILVFYNVLLSVMMLQSITSCNDVRYIFKIKLGLGVVSSFFDIIANKAKAYIIRESKGGIRDAPPPGSKLFHFHAVFGEKIDKIIGWCPSWRLAPPPPSGKSRIRHCLWSV